MTKSRYWVEFVDYDGMQKSIYLNGESVSEVKAVFGDEYEVVVIDNTETVEQPYWRAK
mgnify:CR=1 FL=1